VENVALYDGRKVIRKVSITDQFHADNQLARYGSGLHFGLSQEQFDDLADHRLMVLTPEKEVVHYRAVIMLPKDYDYDSDGPFFKAYEKYAYGEGKADNVKVESGAFGGGSKEISIYVIGDKDLFDSIVAELEEAATKKAA
jgi:hypothetical protein